MKKKDTFFCMFIILLISFSSVPNISLENACNIPPVYSFISMELNGVKKNNVSAQLLIFNETSKKYEENTILKTTISADLSWLSHQISDLDEIYIYYYNDTFLPGEVNFILANVSFENKSIYEKLSDFIETNTERWWYVKSVSPSILPPDGLKFGYAFAPYVSPQDESLVFTYSRSHGVDNTTVLTFRSKDGVVASQLINDGKQWMENVKFQKELVSSIRLLKNLIFEIENISINLLTVEKMKYFIENNSLPLLNLSKPLIFNETFPYNIDFELLGDILLTFYYKKNLNEKEIKIVHKMADVIYGNNWFVNNFVAMAAAGNKTNFPILVFSITSCLLTVKRELKNK
ncbi:MAG: hypothetical protein ACTSP3_08370 [Candidatus Heimdallarchaeaceae archaeon]